MITRRNVFDYPPYRIDPFPTREGALDYYNKIVVQTPRVSLGKQSPKPEPTIAEYTTWLVAENLYDPILNPEGGNYRPIDKRCDDFRPISSRQAFGIPYWTC